MSANAKTLLAAGHNTHYYEAGQGDALFLLHGSGPGVSGWSNWGKSIPVSVSYTHLTLPTILLV